MTGLIKLFNLKSELFIVGGSSNVFIGNNSGDLRYEYGLLAQEVDDLLKEADPENSVITKDNDGLLGMDYKQLIMPLIKSVQELSDEVDRLKKEIEELKK